MSPPPTASAPETASAVIVAELVASCWSASVAVTFEFAMKASTCALPAEPSGWKPIRLRARATPIAAPMPPAPMPAPSAAAKTLASMFRRPAVEAASVIAPARVTVLPEMKAFVVVLIALTASAPAPAMPSRQTVRARRRWPRRSSSSGSSPSRSR